MFPLQKGVSAIFGPDEKASSIHAADICDTKEMPYIDTRWDSESKIPIVNLYPNPPSMAQMLVDLVRNSDWTSFTILYESAEWLPRMSELLQMYDSQGSVITVRRLDLKLSVPNYRPVLRRVKLSSDKCIIVECSIDNLEEILKQAQQVGLMSDQHQFILTNFDSHTIDLEPYQYSGTSITTLRLVDPEHQILKEMAEYLETAGKEGLWKWIDCCGCFGLFISRFPGGDEEAEDGKGAEEAGSSEDGEKKDDEDEEPENDGENEDPEKEEGEDEQKGSEDDGGENPETKTEEPETEEDDSMCFQLD